MLKQTSSSCDRMVDVMADDELLAALRARSLSNATVIFNTQPRSQAGQHWMAMVSCNSKAYIIDNLACFPEIICGSILRNSFDGGGFGEVGSSNTTLQSTDTNVCREYAFAFLACVAAQLGGCNANVAGIQRLVPSQ